MPPPLTDPRKFALAGNAYFTALSAKTGTRFTFRVTRAGLDHPARDTQPPVWWVFLLRGADNTRDYAFLGSLRPDVPGSAQLRYAQSVRSPVRLDAPGARAARWVLPRVANGLPTPHCEIYHEGRCGRCGRLLTVPESIISGFGPECISHL